MTVVCFGTTFREAPVALRERLVFGVSDVRDELYAAGRVSEKICVETVVLSTCNRTEMYAVIEGGPENVDGVFSALISWLTESRGFARGDLEGRFYCHAGPDAVRHLCRVASGLDSLVIGESEILRQITRAVSLADDQGCVGKVLSAVFRTGIKTGRRARAETGINRKPASVSSVAVELADTVAGSLAGKHVLLVGTGKMGRLAGQAIRSRGVSGLTVLSRQLSNAGRLAELFDGVPGTMEDLPAALADADVVITSTAAATVVLNVDTVREAMLGRDSRQLTIVDIAVPRDVDAEVAGIDGVTLFDIDDLKVRIDEHLLARQVEVPNVEAIVDQEMDAFAGWEEQLAVDPLISDLRSHAEQIRQKEMARVLRKLGDADDSTLEQFELFSRSLVNKLLHEPTKRLRVGAVKYRSDEYANLTRDLFGIGTNGDHADVETERRARSPQTA